MHSSGKATRQLNVTYDIMCRDNLVECAFYGRDARECHREEVLIRIREDSPLRLGASAAVRDLIHVALGCSH